MPQDGLYIYVAIFMIVEDLSSRDHKLIAFALKMTNFEVCARMNFRFAFCF
jgi:hypothetical protein